MLWEFLITIFSHQITKVMRCSLILLFFTLLQAYAGNSYSQTAQLNLNLNNATIQDVLDEIENQSEFFFLFNRKLVDVDRSVNVEIENKDIYGTLAQVFKGTNTDYVVIDRQIVLSTKEYLSEVKDVLQDKTIKGRVTDENGEPLEGVTVIVKGTITGVITDSNGDYEIEVPSDAETLVFSYVGMLTQEIPIEDRSEISITLQEDILGLEEVVVIGYGTMRKSDLTGAVSSVSAEEIDDIPVQTIDQALRGRVPGLRITKRSGQPGASSIARIRGINSIQGGNNPLIIVDGFPITGGLDFIDPNDVASVEILKDASSTAIYGARASNGVIMITTKKGKAGAMRVDFDSYYGTQSVSKIIEMANAQEYMEIANVRAVNDGEAQLFFPDPSQITVNTNWQEEVFRTAPIQRHNLTLSGGNDRLRYSVSGNYFDQEGVIKGSDFKQFSFRSNINAELNKRLKIANSLILSRSEQNSSAGLMEAFQAAPTLPVYDETGNYQDMIVYPFSPLMDNPVALIDGITNQDLQTRIFNNFEATFTILDDLSFKSSIGVDYSTSLGNDYIKRFLIEGSPGGKASKSNREAYSLLNENIFNYNKDFDGIRLNAVAAYTWQTYKTSYFSAGSSNFVSDDLLYNALSSGSDIMIPASGGSEWGISSWLGRVNLNWHDKYLLTLSGRADGSSRFAEGNKWAFFPSAALAWRLSEEEWFDSDKLSSMKLRLSAGQTGNQAVAPYQTLVRMSDVQVVFGDALNIGYAPSNMANKELKWETTTQYDAGLDVGLFDEKLRLTLDYYYKKTTDLLAQVDLPQSTGFRSSTQNIGSISNQGFELQIDAVPFTGNFQWDISANFYTNKNKIIGLSKGADVFAPGLGLLSSMHILREGEPLSMFYGYIWDRIDQNGQNAYKDLNDDDEIDNLDRTIIGNPHPDFNAGLNNTFTYKNWQLGIFLEGAFGHDILNVSAYEHMDSFYKGRNQLSKVANDYWTPQNLDAKYPKPSSSLTQLPSDVYVEDGSYVKIRNINLSYSLPVEQIGWIQNASVYVSGENLYTFTNYSWYDPEVNAFSSGDLRIGTDYRTYPQARTYTIGLKLGF